MRTINITDRIFTGDPDRHQGRIDDNALGFAWRPGQDKFSVHINRCMIDANGVAEGLKLSYCHDVHVKNSTIIGGYEDCVDIVRGGDITFDRCRFISNNTKHHFTIKCNVSNVSIFNCEFVNEFRNVFDGACVDLGNWSDYDVRDLPKTRDIHILNNRLTNMRPHKRILARTIHAEAPVTSGPGVVLRVPNMFVRLFWCIRRNQYNKPK